MSQQGFGEAVTAFNQGVDKFGTQYGQFEAGQLLKFENGRGEVNANQLLSLAIKAPAYALEAPLRPLDVATGGFIGGVAKGISEGVNAVPVLRDIIGGAGNGLRALDYAGASAANLVLAQNLKKSIGKADNYMIGNTTAGQVRRNAIERWGTDLEGNQYSLEDLQARAQDNVWNFGQFATSSDGLTDFVARGVLNPLNLVMIPGVGSVAAKAGGAAAGLVGRTAATAAGSELATAAGVRFLEGYSRAASWARPIIKATPTPIATPFRRGYGFAEAMGRGIASAPSGLKTAYHAAHNPNYERQFLDVGNAAKDVMNGGLARSGYTRSFVTAAAQMGRGALRKTLLPGLDTSLKGSQLYGNAARAWMRGGIQQELALLPAQGLVGSMDAYLEENGMQNSFIGGTVNWLHDVLSKVNNDHPLSDQDGFVMAAMFMPWSKGLREIPGDISQARRAAKLEVYGENVAGRVVEEARRLGSPFKNMDEMFVHLGDGDKALGMRKFEYWVDITEVRKAENQLSHLTQQILDAGLDGFAERLNFTAETIEASIKRMRKTGALQPKSTADYMFEQHKMPGEAPQSLKRKPKPGEAEQEVLSHEVTATGMSLFDEIKHMYNAYETLGPQLHALGFNIRKGGVMSRELMDSIISHFDKTDGFDAGIARDILEMGPSLVYEDGPWRQFSISLGQSGAEGKFRRGTPSMSREEVRAALVEVRDRLPSQQELFHQTIRMAKSTSTLRKGVFQVKEPPYPMGKKVRANQLKVSGRVGQLASNERTMTHLREQEFFKSGLPRFGTADTVVGPSGSAFKKRPSGGYFRDDGVGVNIEDGAIRLTIPVEREAQLLTQLDKTIFKSGPRKGQIKPGMEELSQSLNLDIEAARMGIDQEALVLATQNGGRVIVADPIAGPWLARHGYVESARIEHRYPKWIDPGERPVPPKSFTEGFTVTGDPPVPGEWIQVKKDSGTKTLIIDNQMEDGVFITHGPGDTTVLVDPQDVIKSESGWTGTPGGMHPDEVDAIWSEYDTGKQDWDRAMQQGIQRGDITEEEAVKRGWQPGFFEDYQDLPTLYHTTTNIKGVRNKGMMTGAELGDAGAGGTGLGGTPSHVNAFTTDPEVAARIADVLVEAGEFLRGEITPKELLARAKAGGFEKTLVGRGSFERLIKGDFTKIEAVPDAFDAMGGISTWKETKVPMTEGEILTLRDKFYKEFLRAQDDALGGKKGKVEYLDPLMVNDYVDPMKDIRARAKATREDIGIIKARPARPGAKGRPDPSEPYLKEWKVIPEAVELEGISKQASYSFRGGDPQSLLKNAKAGAFRPYRPSRRFERSEAAVIGVARGDARRASMLLPTDMSVGPALTPETSMFPEERLRALKEHIRSSRSAYKNELQKVSEMDAAALEMLPFDRAMSEMGMHDWVDAASATELAKYKDVMTIMDRDFPQLSLDTSPRILVDPAADRFTMLNTTLNRRQKLLLDYGPLAPITRLYDALLAPVASRWLGKMAQNEVHNLLTLEGWEPASTRKFMEELRQFVLDSRSVVGMGKFTGTHMFGSIAAIPEQNVRAIASRIEPVNFQKVVDKYGSYQKMLTSASNRLMRTVVQRERAGGKVNMIEASANAAFKTYQYAPGLEGVSGATQRLTKFLYPFLRFQADPLFVLMNYTEPAIYNILDNGWRGVTAKGKATATTERLSDLASSGLIPPGGLYAKDVPVELLLADPGFYTIPKNIRPHMQAELQQLYGKKAEQVFEAMGKDHPIAHIMRERFGDNVKDWAIEANRMLANMARKGVDGALRPEWKKVLEEEIGLSHAEMKQMVPVYERLSEAYRGIYNQMADLYIGRMSRSNLERLGNSFFVAWPVSYMIKVTSWVYRVMMEKMGPVEGSAGAFLWDSYRQRYEQHVQNDPDFASFVEDNPDFLFALEMVLPVSPASISVGLNKTTRYAGSWFLQEQGLGGSELQQALTGEYHPESIPDMLSGSARFGPLRTKKLIEDTLKSWEAPGFYSEPDVQQYQPLLP
jgi:hypothetical protein